MAQIRFEDLSAVPAAGRLTVVCGATRERGKGKIEDNEKERREGCSAKGRMDPDLVGPTERDVRWVRQSNKVCSCMNLPSVYHRDRINEQQSTIRGIVTADSSSDLPPNQGTVFSHDEAESRMND